jgi:hypothetical protein
MAQFCARELGWEERLADTVAKRARTEERRALQNWRSLSAHATSEARANAARALVLGPVSPATQRAIKSSFSAENDPVVRFWLGYGLARAGSEPGVLELSRSVISTRKPHAFYAQRMVATILKRPGKNGAPQQLGVWIARHEAEAGRRLRDYFRTQRTARRPRNA